jgi:hypothetical protein
MKINKELLSPEELEALVGGQNAEVRSIEQQDLEGDGALLTCCNKKDDEEMK